MNNNNLEKAQRQVEALTETLDRLGNETSDAWEASNRTDKVMERASDLANGAADDLRDLSRRVEQLKRLLEKVAV